MKNILLIIFALLVVTAGIVYAMQSNQATNKGVNMDKKVLVAYFSRTGEQYSVGNITEGNTAIVAKMIAEKTGGDLFEIKVVNDNYPSNYLELTKYAQNELHQKARPEIKGKVENFADYDVVFLGYPNWWADMPMPVYTFIESYDFTGKKVYHFCTHEGSGGVKPGFALFGHIAQNDRKEADKKVSEWLKTIGF